MMNLTFRSLLAVGSLLALGSVACGGETPPAQDPTTTDAPLTAQPVADIPAEPAPVEPAPEAPKPLAVLTKPASAWEAGGSSLSTISASDLQAAFAKAGWKAGDEAPTTLTAGQYEVISFDVEKGKSKGKVQLARPTQAPGTPDTAGTTPSTLGGKLSPDASATSFDEEADVALGFEIEGGKAADAKKTLGTVAKQAKAKK